MSVLQQLTCRRLNGCLYTFLGKNLSMSNVSTSAQGKKNKSLRRSQLHTDIDTDSGISSIRRSRDKVATSISRTNLTSEDEDDEEEHLLRTDLSTEDDENSRRDSDASLITNLTITETPSEFPSSSVTSSRSSEINLPISSLSMVAVSSKQSLAVSSAKYDKHNGKSKNSVKTFFRKIFGSSSSSHHQGKTVTSVEPLNIDLTHGTAYPSMSPLPITQGPIRLFVIRHGERLDRYYSSQWLQQAFDKDGNFCRFSPILPETLPFRDPIRDFDLDPPLTYQGLKEAFHTGAALKEKDMHIHYCYSSPALRCVQTAAKILEGLQLHNKLKIRIEPGLFECTSWYTTHGTNQMLTMPKFLTKKELIDNKYPIDKNYREQMNIAEISQLETEFEFYQRSHAVAAAILAMHENEYISQIQQGQISAQQEIHILFVAHAPTLETCTRKLCGGNFRPDTLGYVIRNVDFLTMTVIEKRDNNCEKWIFRRNSFYGEEF